MRPTVWIPPVDLTPAEHSVVRRIRRAKLFVFLRHQRHAIFTTEFQDELSAIYKESPLGFPPIPPAQLALATILQAYTGVSDDEVIEATTMDRRWQLVLDCLDCTEPPFSKGTLVAFRQRMIDQNWDRRLIERTVEVAATSGGFGSRALRAALDSSPLWGAGRVEDIYNLLGHALKKALSVIARQQGWELAELTREAGAEILGTSSLKAALDRDWDDPTARALALRQVLAAVTAVEQWLDEHPVLAAGPGDATPQIVRWSQSAVEQIMAQDVEIGVEGQPTLRRGVAPERRISIEDPQMRHGRKSRSQKINGYKRHVVHDLDTGLVRAVGVTPANAPEATVTPDLAADLDAQQVTLGELHLDRAYLTSHWVRERSPDLAIYCKAWPVRNRHGFAKTAFSLDWDLQTIACPHQIVIPFHLGQTVHFPAEICATCPLRVRCTTSDRGRSVAIHPDERLLEELRERQATPTGRAQLRERVQVEHTLAHVGRWQGRRARYRGLRKNLFDLRRCAVVQNLHVIARLPEYSQAA